MNTAGYTYKTAQSTVIIQEAGWAKEDTIWVCAIAEASVCEDTDVDVFVERESIGVPLCTAVEPEDGKARLYAFAKPKGDVNIIIKMTEVRTS